MKRIMAICVTAFLVTACGGDFQGYNVNASGLCADGCPQGLVCGNTRTEKNVCTDPTTAVCNDGVQNNGESDTDCGHVCLGSSPPNLCPIGMQCGADNDCNYLSDSLKCSPTQHRCRRTDGANCLNTVDCNDGLVCSGGKCTGGNVTHNCGTVDCPSGQFCANPSTSTCQQNNCGPVNCPSGQACVNSTTGTCQTNTVITCGSVTCPVGYFCNQSQVCQQNGTVTPGNVCTSDTQCAPGICLPLQSGQAQRFCSMYPFALRCSVTIPSIVSYNAPGTHIGPLDQTNWAANTQFWSSPANNIAAMVAPGIPAAQCIQTCFISGAFLDRPASGLNGQTNATGTWNCTLP